MSELNELTFSRRGRALVGQKMFKIMDEARRIEEKGFRVYHLELGNPRLVPPPGCIDVTVASLERQEISYTYSAGYPPLRQAIAKLYTGRLGRTLTEASVTISPANLIISQFLDLVCDRGDRVVFFTPAFPTYWLAAAHIGLSVTDVALDPAIGFDLSDADVDRALAAEPRAIIVNSANNPTGAVYGRAVLERLATECERRGIWLLSDETYGEVSFGRPFFSLLDLDLPHVVVMSSFSKMFSLPGFRTGYVVAHPKVAEKFALSVSTLISCLPIFTQTGCIQGMESLEPYTAKVRERYSTIAAWCLETLGRSGRLSVTPPAAGCYLFIDISATGMDDQTFARRLLEEAHTAVTPGSSFGPAYTDYIRAAICGLEEDVRIGIERIHTFIERL